MPGTVKAMYLPSFNLTTPEVVGITVSISHLVREAHTG